MDPEPSPFSFLLELTQQAMLMLFSNGMMMKIRQNTYWVRESLMI
jgi:hypothetical protein